MVYMPCKSKSHAGLDGKLLSCTQYIFTHQRRSLGPLESAFILSLALTFKKTYTEAGLYEVVGDRNGGASRPP